MNEDDDLVSETDTSLPEAQRPEESVFFEPTPGPGDSDGGDVFRPEEEELRPRPSRDER